MKLFDIDKAALAEWLEGRPQVIHDLWVQVPINYLYRLTTTGQLVTIAAYAEDGTVRVNVDLEHNPHILIELSVFGIDPDDLVPWKKTHTIYFDDGSYEEITN